MSSVLIVIVANAVVGVVFAPTTPVIILLAVTDVPEPVWGDRRTRSNTYQGIGWVGELVVGTV